MPLNWSNFKALVTTAQKPVQPKITFSCPLCVPLWIFSNQDEKPMKYSSSAFHSLTPKPIVLSLIPGHKSTNLSKTIFSQASYIG